jgi:hypothetical protein
MGRVSYHPQAANQGAAPTFSASIGRERSRSQGSKTMAMTARGIHGLQVSVGPFAQRVLRGAAFSRRLILRLLLALVLSPHGQDASRETDDSVRLADTLEGCRLR